MRTIATTGFFLTFAVTAAAIQLNGNADFVKSYPSAGGTVRFPHGKHASKLNDQCNFCHSAFRTFGGVSQMYGHKFCGECHQHNDGPANCTDCHDLQHKISKKR